MYLRNKEKKKERRGKKHLQHCFSSSIDSVNYTEFSTLMTVNCHLISALSAGFSTLSETKASLAVRTNAPSHSPPTHPHTHTDKQNNGHIQHNWPPPLLFQPEIDAINISCFNQGHLEFKQTECTLLLEYKKFQNKNIDYQISD